MRHPNGSFTPVVEGHYKGLCDKGPMHGEWVEWTEFRFYVKRGSAYLGQYVYQFGIWVWQGGCWPAEEEE